MQRNEKNQEISVKVKTTSQHFIRTNKKELENSKLLHCNLHFDSETDFDCSFDLF